MNTAAELIYDRWEGMYPTEMTKADRGQRDEISQRQRSVGRLMFSIALSAGSRKCRRGVITANDRLTPFYVKPLLGGA